MSGESKGAIPGVILGTVGQLNGLLAAGLAIVATYKAARAAWQAAHPKQDPKEAGFLTDAELIDLMAKEGNDLANHVDQVKARHGLT